MKKKRKYVSEDRRRQVETMKARHGREHYEEIGRRAATFRKQPELAKLAALKRWHPEYFLATGEIKEEYRGLL